MPKNSEIAEFVNIAEAQVDLLLSGIAEVASLDTSVCDDGNTVLSELIASNDSYCPIEIAFMENIKEILAHSLSLLSEREREIIKLRFGMNGKYPKTLDDIGKSFEITRERVRQIQNRAIIKMSNFSHIKELERVL